MKKEECIGLFFLCGFLYMCATHATCEVRPGTHNIGCGYVLSIFAPDGGR